MNPSHPETDTTSSLGKSSTPSHVAGCFTIFCTIAIWVFDIVTLSILVTDFSARSLFYFLFMIPFNALVWLLLGGYVAQAYLPKEKWWFWGTGIQITEEGTQVRFRLPRVSPSQAAFYTAFAGPILMCLTFGVLLLIGDQTTTLLVVGVVLVALTLASIVVAYLTAAQLFARGKSDLVINRMRGTFALPQTFGRYKSITGFYADLVEIRVVTKRESDDEGYASWKHQVTIQWRDADGGLKQGTLAEVYSLDAANFLLQSIRDATGLGSSRMTKKLHSH